MNIGYHHHVPTALVAPGVARLPAYWGLFIDELAKQAGSVTYYTFSCDPTPMEDYELAGPRVRCVDLGRRPSAPAMLLHPGKVLKRVDLRSDGIDALLVRGPGPLLPGLVRAARANSLPASALIAGDYRSWRPWKANAAWRNVLIRAYMLVYRLLQQRALRDVLVLAQNPWLLEKVGGASRVAGHVVFTSALTDDMIRDFDARGFRGPRDLPPGGAVRLLYTGRIVEEKGVLHLVEALSRLTKAGMDAQLELVGWSPEGDPTTRLIAEAAARLGVSDRLKVSGYVPAGPQLMAKYAEADIYVFASPTEWGTTHTILEAMVARLPVVSSRIEGHTGLLVDGEHAVLVPPGSPEALAEGVERVVSSPELWEGLSRRGREFAEARTNERSVSLVVEHLEALVRGRKPLT